MELREVTAGSAQPDLSPSPQPGAQAASSPCDGPASLPGSLPGRGLSERHPCGPVISEMWGEPLALWASVAPTPGGPRTRHPGEAPARPAFLPALPGPRGAYPPTDTPPEPRPTSRQGRGAGSVVGDTPRGHRRHVGEGENVTSCSLLRLETSSNKVTKTSQRVTETSIRC